MDRLRALRLFLRIAETGSITGAGRAMGLSRTAASKALAELESALALWRLYGWRPWAGASSAP